MQLFLSQDMLQSTSSKSLEIDMRNFNPDMLGIARNFRGFSQTELIVKMNHSITQASLSKIENGDLKPSAEVVNNLSKSLNFPPRFFEHSERLNALPISLHAYRKQASTTSKALSKMNAEMMLKMNHARTLDLVTDVPTRHDLVYFKIGQDVSNAEEAATKLRAQWKLGTGPIKDLTAAIEDAGVLVFLCDFEDSNVDGVSLKMQDTAPCIFLNARQPNDRIRFTLAHELGHLVLHTEPSEHMEKEANDFAAEFLMPQVSIVDKLGSINLTHYAILKKEWKVSMAALIYRASSLGTITASQNSYLWRQMATRGYRKVEPNELEREPTFRVASKLFDYARFIDADRNKIVRELSQIFDLHEEDFKALYQFDLDSMEKIEMIS